MKSSLSAALIGLGALLGAAPESGISLSGRSEREEPPSSFTFYRSGTQEKAAQGGRSWGFTALPPGEYDLRLVYRYGEGPVSYPGLKVEEGKTTALALSSGVELTGRSEKEGPPHLWHLLKAGTKEKAASVNNRWGFTPVPPGDYDLRVVYRYGEGEGLYSRVKVEEGKAAQVALSSGVELTGRSEKEGPPHLWHLLKAGTQEKAASVNNRWGFTPLPAGEYDLRLLYRYGEEEETFERLRVEEGKVTAAAVTTGAELAGRSPEEDPPYVWRLVKSETQEKAIRVNHRWGYTPAPPGRYDLRLVYRYGEAEVAYTALQVEEGKVSAVVLGTGVEVAGGSEKEDPPYIWRLVKAGTSERTAQVDHRWGFTPVPPGDYDLRIVYRYGEREVLFSTVKVEEGKVSPVFLRTGVEVTARSPKEDPPYVWSLFKAGSEEKAAEVNSRWGFTTVPPGDYDLRLVYRYGESEIRYAALKVEQGKTTSIALKTGIELGPRSEGEAPPLLWTVSTEGSPQPLATMRQRFGFTPLPPGSYSVEARSQDQLLGRMSGLSLGPDTIKRLTLDDLESRTPPPADAGGEGLPVRVKAGDTLNELEWDPPAGRTVKGYRVYRSGSRRPIHGERLLQSPSFLDLGLTNGKGYTYQVTAVLSDQSEWKGYREASATPRGSGS